MVGLKVVAYRSNHYLSLCLHSYVLFNWCLCASIMQLAFIATEVSVYSFLLATFPLCVFPLATHFCFFPKLTSMISASVFKSSVMSSFFWDGGLLQKY